MSKASFVLICFSFLFCTAHAQVPVTDIYVLDMNMSHGKYSFTNAQKINDWKGYNNQPYFTPDGKSIYYVSYRDKQADIYKYDRATGKTSQFTHTQEDEYSPKLSADGKYITVVRVMKDSAQQLWAFPTDGGAPEKVLNSDSIAYYEYLEQTGTKTRLVYSTVPEPMHLHIWKEDEGRGQNLDKTIGENSSRTFQPVTYKKQNLVLYIQKGAKTDSIYQVKSIDDALHVKDVVKTLPNCEDFAAGPDNTLYMGCKGKLYAYRIGKDKQWNEIADFTGMPYKNFYRLAVSADGRKIALVAYEGKKP